MATRVRIPFRRGSTRPSADAMTLGEHLAELRRRVVISVFAFAIGATVAFIVYPSILHFLQAPYCRVAPGRCKLYVTAPLDGLSLRIKLSTYGGLFFSSPVILWELWRFITPGLHRNEKRYAIPFVASSIAALRLRRLPGVLGLPPRAAVPPEHRGPHAPADLQPQQLSGPDRGAHVGIRAHLRVPGHLGVARARRRPDAAADWRRWRRWAIVGIVVFAAVITPSGDPFSMLALAVPMYVFYEVSILIGRFLHR